MSRLSVIICTHNPKAEYLQRMLDGLAAQTLPMSQWELLLIDYASDAALAPQWNLAWHPRGRTIREDTLGLTPARLRGVRESAGDILVYVDDDNVLAPDYLQTVRPGSTAASASPRRMSPWERRPGPGTCPLLPTAKSG